MKRTDAAARNVRSLAVFEAVYKMGAALLFAPLAPGTVSLLMRVNGYAYLTHENIRAFLTSPLTVLTLAALAVLGALYTTADAGAVLFAMDQTRQGASVTPGQIGRFALRNAVRACRGKNLPVMAAILCLLPLLYLGTGAELLAAVSVPAFILRYLRAHPMLPVAAAAVVLVMTAVAVRWLYAACCCTVEGCSFSGARKRCAVLGRGKRLFDLGALLAAEAAFAAAGTVLMMGAMAFASLLGRLFVRAGLPDWTGASALWLAIVLVLSASAALAVPVGYGCVGLLYYRRAAAAGGPAGRTSAPPVKGGSRRCKWRRVAGTGAVCLLAAGVLTLGVLLSAGGIDPEIEYLRTVQVTAHRGASALYPENTMAAFAGALELGADWIELDVQQSGDGRLVVSHDANLKRTTGRNVNVWELTYDEIAVLDAGGERIPLLEEVLAFARENGLHLNIELKPTGHERDLERDTVDAIRRAEMEDMCVVTSQSYGVLERVKEYDSTVTTVYVMRLAYGGVDKLAAADDFSVAAESVTRSLVSRVHNAGRELYVWTVNTRRDIERMIELGVDNIITDDVDLAKQCVYESRYSELTEDYVDLLTD